MTGGGRASACGGKGKVAPALAATRLCDLLMQFPSAAIGGVQWNALARRYEERYGTRLDIASLGHESALMAATSLLWDVLRLVDGVDTDNPVVAVEDAVALTPRPGFMASWPSLYKTLCGVVHSNGTEELPDECDDLQPCPPVRSLLLSKLKQLLVQQWHSAFDDSSLSCLSEEGTTVKMKKLKHLVQAVLRWRDQRIEWRKTTSGRPSVADSALEQRLELIASKRHNDFVLRFLPQVPESLPSAQMRCAQPCETAAAACEVPPSIPAPDGQATSESDLAQELAVLRAENEALRWSNQYLEVSANAICAGRCSGCEEAANAVVQLDAEDDSWGSGRPVEIFDDPYEPPPQKPAASWASMASPAQSSTASTSDLHAQCSTTTTDTPGRSDAVSPALSRSSSVFLPHSRPSWPPSAGQSGPMTPVMPTAMLGNNVCALVPVWFLQGSFKDRCAIPTGIVDRFRTRFESNVGSTTTAPLVVSSPRGRFLPPVQRT